MLFVVELVIITLLVCVLYDFVLKAWRRQCGAHKDANCTQVRAGHAKHKCMHAHTQAQAFLLQVSIQIK